MWIKPTTLLLHHGYGRDYPDTNPFQYFRKWNLNPPARKYNNRKCNILFMVNGRINLRLKSIYIFHLHYVESLYKV